jgi:hypothetical protein
MNTILRLLILMVGGMNEDRRDDTDADTSA